jgi:outer membrane protein
MRRWVIVWSVVVVMMGWSAGVSAQALKIGVIDAQAVLDRSKIGQQSKGALEVYVKSRQQIIDLDEEELRGLEEELRKQGTVLSPEAQREKQETLQRKLISYQKRASELNKEVQDRRTEVLKQFNAEMTKAVAKVAKRDGFTLVLDREQEGGVVLFAQEKMDVTENVIVELDKNVAAAGGSAVSPKEEER